MNPSINGTQFFSSKNITQKIFCLLLSSILGQTDTVINDHIQKNTTIYIVQYYHHSTEIRKKDACFLSDSLRIRADLFRIDSISIENRYFSVVILFFKNKTKQFNLHPFHLHFLLHLFRSVQNFPKYIDYIDIKTNNSL